MPSSSPSNLLRTIPIKRPKRPCLVESIFALCSQNKLHKAVDSLPLLSSRGIRLDTLSLVFLLDQCRTTRSLALAKSLHLHLKLTGRKKPNTFLSNHLIGLYFSCGSDAHARRLFDKMPVRNVFSWNAMLSGYAKLGMMNHARRVFDRMPERDVVSWNTLLIGLARNGFGKEAVGVYVQLRRSSVGFNEYSFSGVLIACVRLEELVLARQVHGQVLIFGFLSNLVISSSILDVYAKCGCLDDANLLFTGMPVRDVLAWTALVSGYARSGDLQSARTLFDGMPVKNDVSWTALIGGYVRHGLELEALDLFIKMVAEGVKPDQFTFSSCLCACASIASLKHGKQIHAHLMRTGFNPNAIVISTLIDMYSKCGCLEDAHLVFNHMALKEDIVLWNTMIAALAQHGHGKEALALFDKMVKGGTKPNDISFMVILMACSHSGLVEEGTRIFESMIWKHGIVPGQEHYACLIDLLGRAGRFDQAIEWIEKMPCSPDNRVWNALLGACRIHGNIELGIRAAEHLLEMEPQSSAAYVLLSNMLAAVGRWESVEKVRHLMNERQVRKERAISWIEVESNVHTFTVTDQLHPMTEEIFEVLEQLAGQMEDIAPQYVS
ncbi:Pentatricopeptide repeat-containing protein [Asimina triloba]